MAHLTAPQKAMVLNSEPGRELTLEAREGYGVELLSGADYAVAKALARKGLGKWTQGSPGGPSGMYWNTAEGVMGLKFRAMPRRPDKWNWITYALAALTTIAATVDPTWPRWQLGVIALALGFLVGSDVQAHLICRSGEKA